MTTPALPSTETASGARDFDFLFGAWRVRHRRLKERLAGCVEWEEFDGECQAQPVLSGVGNVDHNTLELPGGHYRAMTLRTFDVTKGTWSIWWFDARYPGELDPPVVGRFSDGVGEFFVEMVFKGRPTRVRFWWSHTASDRPRWEQAFSSDGGETWETNWVMEFTRAN